MKFVSLFAGIGGIDLGLERAGHECVGQVEIDPYAQKVLARHWPDTPRIADVRTFEGHEFGPFDLLTGGYPCQPFSHAGKRAGADDPRHLWPEVHRIIRNVRPHFVLLENVPGHLSLGFGRVLGDLAESGYDAEWDCIPASAVGAPHQRDRVWIVAYPQGEPERAGLRAGEQGWLGRGRPSDGRSPLPDPESDGRGPGRQGRPPSEHPGVRDTAGSLADADRKRELQPRGPVGEVGRRTRDGGRPLAHASSDTRRFRHRNSRAHGGQWTVEPDVGRVANGVPNRTHRLRALGNAVVPQVAELIGQRLPA